MDHWRAIHLPHPNWSIHTNQIDLAQFILSEQEMISSGHKRAWMCTECDRVKLIRSRTLSADYIKIDACVATLFFFCFFFLFGVERIRLLAPQPERFLFIVTAVQRMQKNVHFYLTACATIRMLHYYNPMLWLTMSECQINRRLINYKYRIWMC